MQKWEKFLLLSLCILWVIGSLIGFAITSSGIGYKTILANIDIFSLLELVLLITVIACAAFDFYETFDSLKQFQSPKFKIIINTQKRQRNISIFLGFLCLFEFGVFFYFFDIYTLLLLLITIILTSILLYHNTLDNFIDDNGILYWGIYYTWNDIKSYNIKNEMLLEINILNILFGLEYHNIIQLSFKETEKDNLEKLIAKKLSSSTI